MTEAKIQQTEWKQSKPIIRDCPNCNETRKWYWTTDDMNFKNNLTGENVLMPKGSLVCGGCGWVLNPLVLNVKPLPAWKEDKENYEMVKFMKPKR